MLSWLSPGLAWQTVFLASFNLAEVLPCCIIEKIDVESFALIAVSHSQVLELHQVYLCDWMIFCLVISSQHRHRSDSALGEEGSLRAFLQAFLALCQWSDSSCIDVLPSKSCKACRNACNPQTFYISSYDVSHHAAKLSSFPYGFVLGNPVCLCTWTCLLLSISIKLVPYLKLASLYFHSTRVSGLPIVPMVGTRIGSRS